MEILLYALASAALVSLGALLSGGVRLPERRRAPEDAEETAEDALSRDIAALMAYGREEEQDAV